MRPIALSDVIAVGEVPTSEEISILAKAGFRSLLNVQPEGEVPRLMDSSEMRTLAATAGLVYACVPIESRRPDDDRVAEFAKAMSSLPVPIYACCYSGSRAAAAWALAMAPKTAPKDIVEACTGAGYDMSSLVRELERRHAGLPAPRSPEPPVPATSNAAAPVTSAAAAVAKSEAMIVLPRAATAGGFAVSG